MKRRFGDGPVSRLLSAVFDLVVINVLCIVCCLPVFTAGASLSSGFPNLSYFYREFKKKYGMTPKQFIEAMPKEGINPHKFE